MMVDCKHDVVPCDDPNWGRCTKCGDETFPLTASAAYGGEATTEESDLVAEVVRLRARLAEVEAKRLDLGRQLSDRTDEWTEAVALAQRAADKLAGERAARGFYEACAEVAVRDLKVEKARAEQAETERDAAVARADAERWRRKTMQSRAETAERRAEQMGRERDEARRTVCEMGGSGDAGVHRTTAKLRGWPDLYPGSTEGDGS